MLSEDVDLDLDQDYNLDLYMDLNNDYVSRAVENAIRGCGPCSPEPEPAGGGGQYVVFISAPLIDLLYIFAS